MVFCLYFPHINFISCHILRQCWMSSLCWFVSLVYSSGLFFPAIESMYARICYSCLFITFAINRFINAIYFCRLHLTVWWRLMVSWHLNSGRRLASVNLHSKSTPICWQSPQQRPWSWRRKGRKLKFTSFAFIG